MPKGDVHTMYDRSGKRWVNKVEGNKNASNSARTQEAAARKGKQMARKSKKEHLLHRKSDNTIRQRSTYPRSRDPRSSRG